MSRAVPFRRICPKKVQARIDKAARSRFFVVQELGPMAFIIEAPPSPAEPSAATDAPDPPVNTTSRKYKVSLGSTQSCSCSQFLRERELCVHVLWLMLKVFKIPKDSETIYQISLVEREVTELLQCRRQRGTGVDSSSVEQPATLANETPSDEVTPRCIGEDDTCPICLEDITGCAASSLTYCRKSCGNWMHVKCVKVLVDHQAKSLGMGNAKCPLCRNDLGNIEDLKAELQAQEKEHLQKKKERSRKPHVHRGIKCRECHRDPIIGKCHRCTGCQDFFLCNSCFETAAHSEHAFTHKSRPSSPSKLSPRRVAPTLPSSVLSEMQSRELRDQDYEMLLTLDEKTVNQGNLPIHIVSSFPVEKATSSTWVGSTCGVCLKKVTHGEIIRKIPCSHGFHRSCIVGFCSIEQHALHADCRLTLIYKTRSQLMGL
ncbi:hypothetical protein DFS34DRAFT_488472 [Phlyctochytrium arcticum]|nr:hypothetical protein DFS34DRAFT_488472 [Phlyctochytrium arcticum]